VRRGERRVMAAITSTVAYMLSRPFHSASSCAADEEVRHSRNPPCRKDAAGAGGGRRAGEATAPSQPKRLYSRREAGTDGVRPSL